MAKNDPLLLMSGARIQRSVNRMAYLVAEDSRSDCKMLIVGLKNRGFAVATLLAESLSSILHNDICLSAMAVGNNKEPAFKESDKQAMQKDFDYIIIADDVIFSGKTMLGAIQKVARQYQPSILRTMVLIDRGHRTVPVDVSFCGLKLPTKLNEHVSVYLEKGVPRKVVLKTASG